MITKWADAQDVRVETNTDFPGLISIYETELHTPVCVDLAVPQQRDTVLVGLLSHMKDELDNFTGSWSDEQYDVYDSIIELLEYLK